MALSNIFYMHFIINVYYSKTKISELNSLLNSLLVVVLIKSAEMPLNLPTGGGVTYGSCEADEGEGERRRQVTATGARTHDEFAVTRDLFFVNPI